MDLNRFPLSNIERGEDIIRNLDILVKTTENDIDKEPKINELCEISEKLELYYQAFLASFLELEGYYFVIADVSIKGKPKVMRINIPIKAKVSDIKNFREHLNDVFIDKSLLEQYMIKINFIYIYWVPKNPLMIIFNIDIESEKELLFQKVGERDFETAVEIADSIRSLSAQVKLAERKIVSEAIAVNNYGFCLINVNSIDKATKYLHQCKDTQLISKVNLAYAYYAKNDYRTAINMLKGIVKKNLGKDEKTRFLHLALNHPNLPLENRLAEYALLFNMAAWNIALITCQQKKEMSIVNSYLKKVKPSGDEILVDRRVRIWINYFRGNINKALEEARRLQSDCYKIEYLHKDVEKDIEIFNI